MKNCNDSLIDGLENENHSADTYTKNKSSPKKQVNSIKIRPESISKIANVRLQCRVVEQAQESYLHEWELEAESTENKISEDILKYMPILLRLSTFKGKVANTESFFSLGESLMKAMGKGSCRIHIASVQN